jgi:hypothetical protein
MSLPLKTLSSVGVSPIVLYPLKNPSTGVTEPLQGFLESGLGKNEKGLFSEKTAHSSLLSGVKEVKGDSPKGIGAKRRPLTSEGRQPLVWFWQWIRFVGTRAVRIGVESLFLWKKRGFICPQNQWLPEHGKGLSHAQKPQNQCQKQWHGLKGFESLFFTIYSEFYTACESIYCFCIDFY